MKTLFVAQDAICAVFDLLISDIRQPAGDAF